MGLAPGPAMANDVAFGGAGADLVPIAEARIRMLSEDIVIERMAPGGYRILGDGHWQIHATYRFQNISSEPVQVQMGFPEPACPEDGDCSFAGFEAMETKVRGEAAELRLGAVDRKHAWADHIERVHLFDVSFAPAETVDVTHAYRHGLSEHVTGGEDLTYITRTGAPWAGSIETARFRVRLPFRPWGASLPDWESRLTGLTETLVDGRPEVEFSFQWSDWEPEHDLRFYFGPGHPTLESPALVEGCPAFADVFSSTIAVDAIDMEEVRQHTRSLSGSQLRICRNAIFAHHGKEFASPELNAFFYGESGLELKTPGGHAQHSAVFARNPAYSPAMLSDAERAYVKALELVER